MMRKAPHTSAAPEHGFVLVAVLWIIAALSALATIFAIYLSNSAHALALGDTGVQTEALVSASVELTAYQLWLTADNARPSQGSFRYRLDNADIDVSFVSETARIDLNLAPKELLANLFSGLGASQENAEQYADRVIAWRTLPKADSTEDEVSLYRAAGLAYSPRQAPFAHVNELALVVGFSPALVDRALPFVTVFSGQPKIDALVAPPEVLAALPGMTPSGLKEFLSARPNLPRDAAAVAAALGPAQAGATIDKSNFFRIVTAIKFDNGRQTSSEVVIELRGKEDPYRVLSWRDEVETTTRRPRALAGGGDDL
ncbi:MAG TPA: type II secretion system minor pseudopilin GspK [Bradyrhizobium sp.]|nr:type II secretion system minor pseudopilin GspK [Bradyrhizobium sp.]